MKPISYKQLMGLGEDLYPGGPHSVLLNFKMSENALWQRKIE